MLFMFFLIFTPLINMHVDFFQELQQKYSHIKNKHDRGCMKNFIAMFHVRGKQGRARRGGAGISLRSWSEAKSWNDVQHALSWLRLTAHDACMSS